jgi:hypothetical protein
MKPASPERYDDERVARLLAALRPAPEEWVARAKLIPLTEVDARELAEKLDADPVFRKSFDEDPVGAAEAAGMPELAIQLQRELAELVELAERIVASEDPARTLAGASFPAEAAEPLLRALAVETELPEVVAHAAAKPPLRARLLLLLLRSRATTRRLGGNE